MSTETLALSKESNKPRKPLTTYCIFFRIEKNYIYQKVNKGRVDPNDLPPPEQRFDPDNPGFDCPPFPKRYKGVILPKNFYKTLPRGLEWEGKRRQHRKRDYGMPLPELSRTISTNWKTAEREVLDYCGFMANYGKELSYKELASGDVQCSENDKSSDQGGNDTINPEIRMTSEKTPFSDIPNHRVALTPYAGASEIAERACQGNSRPQHDSFCHANQQPQDNQEPRYFSTRDLADYRRITEHRLQKLREQRLLLQRARSAQNRNSFASSHPSLLRSGLLNQANLQQKNFQMNLIQHRKFMESSPSLENVMPPLARRSRHQDFMQAAVTPLLPPAVAATNVRNPEVRDAPSRFNIFCQLERQYILQRELDAPPSAIAVTSNSLFDPVEEGFGSELILPRRYKGLLIPSRFYASCPNQKLEEVMIVKFDLPCGIKCEYDISECISMRWRANVDNEILEFCDVLRRRLVMESITPSTFPTDYQAGGNVALLGSAKRHLDPDHEVERDSKRSHNDVSFDRVRNCNDEDIIRNLHVSAGRGDMPTIVTSREIRRFLHSHNSDLQDTEFVND